MKQPKENTDWEEEFDKIWDWTLWGIYPKLKDFIHKEKEKSYQEGKRDERSKWIR